MIDYYLYAYDSDSSSGSGSSSNSRKSDSGSIITVLAAEELQTHHRQAECANNGQGETEGKQGDDRDGVSGQLVTWDDDDGGYNEDNQNALLVSTRINKVNNATVDHSISMSHHRELVINSNLANSQSCNISNNNKAIIKPSNFHLFGDERFKFVNNGREKDQLKFNSTHNPAHYLSRDETIYRPVSDQTDDIKASTCKGEFCDGNNLSSVAYDACSEQHLWTHVDHSSTSNSKIRSILASPAEQQSKSRRKDICKSHPASCHSFVHARADVDYSMHESNKNADLKFVNATILRTDPFARNQKATANETVSIANDKSYKNVLNSKTSVRTAVAAGINGACSIDTSCKRTTNDDCTELNEFNAEECKFKSTSTMSSPVNSMSSSVNSVTSSTHSTSLLADVMSSVSADFSLLDNDMSTEINSTNSSTNGSIKEAGYMPELLDANGLLHVVKATNNSQMTKMTSNSRDNCFEKQNDFEFDDIRSKFFTEYTTIYNNVSSAPISFQLEGKKNIHDTMYSETELKYKSNDIEGNKSSNNDCLSSIKLKETNGRNANEKSTNGNFCRDLNVFDVIQTKSSTSKIPAFNSNALSSDISLSNCVISTYTNINPIDSRINFTPTRINSNVLLKGHDTISQPIISSLSTSTTVILAKHSSTAIPTFSTKRQNSLFCENGDKNTPLATSSPIVIPASTVVLPAISTPTLLSPNAANSAASRLHHVLQVSKPVTPNLINTCYVSCSNTSSITANSGKSVTFNNPMSNISLAFDTNITPNNIIPSKLVESTNSRDSGSVVTANVSLISTTCISSSRLISSFTPATFSRVVGSNIPLTSNELMATRGTVTSSQDGCHFLQTSVALDTTNKKGVSHSEKSCLRSQTASQTFEFKRSHAPLSPDTNNRVSFSPVTSRRQSIATFNLTPHISYNQQEKPNITYRTFATISSGNNKHNRLSQPVFSQSLLNNSNSSDTKSYLLTRNKNSSFISNKSVHQNGNTSFTSSYDRNNKERKNTITSPEFALVTDNSTMTPNELNVDTMSLIVQDCFKMCVTCAPTEMAELKFNDCNVKYSSKHTMLCSDTQSTNEVRHPVVQPTPSASSSHFITSTQKHSDLPVAQTPHSLIEEAEEYLLHIEAEQNLSRKIHLSAADDGINHYSLRGDKIGHRSSVSDNSLTTGATRRQRFDASQIVNNERLKLSDMNLRLARQHTSVSTTDIGHVELVTSVSPLTVDNCNAQNHQNTSFSNSQNPSDCNAKICHPFSTGCSKDISSYLTDRKIILSNVTDIGNLLREGSKRRSIRRSVDLNFMIIG